MFVFILWLYLCMALLPVDLKMEIGSEWVSERSRCPLQEQWMK